MPRPGWRAWTGTNYWIAPGRKWLNAPTRYSLVWGSMLRKAWFSLQTPSHAGFSLRPHPFQLFLDSYVSAFRNRQKILFTRPTRFAAISLIFLVMKIWITVILSIGSSTWFTANGLRKRRFTRSVISISTRLETAKLRGN